MRKLYSGKYLFQKFTTLKKTYDVKSYRQETGKNIRERDNYI
jgi:hypothetical protein